MQVRADFFNIFNHPNFSNPGVALLLCGRAERVRTPTPTAIRQGNLAITATPDVGSGNPFLGGGGPRDIQLGVRFSF